MAVEKEPLLELRDVHAGYGELSILKGVSFGVGGGTVTSVIGANGAGKSTLLKTIFGMLKVREGDVSFEGRSIAALGTVKRLKAGIAIVPQGRCNFPQMTIRENLEMGAYTRSDDGIEADLQHMVDQFPILREKLHLLAGDMSGGQQQMLEMAMALMVRPRVLLLDEPSLGLSPMMIDEVFTSIRSLAEVNGMAIIMVEQNAVQALKISDLGVVIELGRVSATGTGPEMLNDPDIRKAYLGLPVI
ncbi:ABC transporter ATP-binding protein [Neoaquamicrobium microcysteis]|uniref:ABC transporter ATP-binding protein n=1 Tax=Neoaquamicrobium microcysteis TaxID=2682781 RepID=UPI00191BDFD8|nr:ABC transporter ATP-binding protein [Mesorhizobium microcysteis]